MGRPNSLVRKERLELSRLAALEPKSSASTNSATFALPYFQHQGEIIARVDTTHLASTASPSQCARAK